MSIKDTDEKKLFCTNEILSTVYAIEKVKIYNHYGKVAHYGHAASFFLLHVHTSTTSSFARTSRSHVEFHVRTWSCKMVAMTVERGLATLSRSSKIISFHQCSLWTRGCISSKITLSFMPPSYQDLATPLRVRVKVLQMSGLYYFQPFPAVTTYGYAYGYG